MNLTPLLKGLRLGPTKVFLHEYKVLTTSLGFTNEAERIVAEFTIPAPEDGFEGRDEWIVDQDFMMPTSLSKCTQDVQISTFIKVTHKLKFAVSLLNPDGHVSELRASLPVCLFISPNVTITSLHRRVSGPSNGTSAVAGPSSSGGSSSSHAGPYSEAESEEPQEDQLFAAAANTNTHLTGADVNAPPNYQDHIYDRLWREIPDSSIETPFASEPSTPYARSRRNSLESHDNMGFGPLDRSRLLSNLYALQERQNREDSVGLPPDRSSSGANLTGTSPHHSRFSSRSTSGANTPREGFNALQMTTATGSPPVTSHTPSIAIDSANAGQNHQLQFAVSPDFSHLSHPTSPVGPQSPANASYLELESLSRVPSYHTAISTAASPTFESAPSYDMSVPGSPTYFSPPSSLPRHLAGGAGSHSMSNIAAAHNRAKSHRSNASAPGSALNLHSLNLKLSRITIGNGSSSNNPSNNNNNKNNSNGSSGVAESRSPRLSFSVPHTRSHSSSNLQGLVGTSNSGATAGAASSQAIGSSASGPSGSNSSSGFFRSSSRTHLASLGNNPTNGNSNSGSNSSSGANTNRNTPNPRGGLSHANRNSSSRSLFDEATRFLHLSHK